MPADRPQRREVVGSVAIVVVVAAAIAAATSPSRCHVELRTTRERGLRAQLSAVRPDGLGPKKQEGRIVGMGRREVGQGEQDLVQRRRGPSA